MKKWTFVQINSVKDRVAQDVTDKLKENGVIPTSIVTGIGRKNEMLALEFRLQTKDLSLTTDWTEKCQKGIDELIAETEDYPLATIPYKIVLKKL